MRKHLRIVLALFFNIDGEDLLEPEGQLDKVIPFQGPVHGATGEVGPKFTKVEPILGIVHYVLKPILAEGSPGHRGHRRFPSCEETKERKPPYHSQ